MHALSPRTPARTAAHLGLAALAVLGVVVSAPALTAQAAEHDKTATGRAIGPVATVVAPVAATAKAPAKAAATPVKAAAAAKPAAAPAPKTYADNLDGWIAEARDVLRADGDQVPSAASIAARAMTESSGNPRAENHWDANEALYGGTYGLIQTIKPTFAAWSLPGHRDILDPVDSIIAGVRYANDRYGSFETIAYGKQGY